MKKALTLISGLVLMVGAVTVLSSVAEAQQLAQERIPVNANVAKYAKITVITKPMNFGLFTGAPNEERGPADNAVFEVETNTALNLKFSGGDLTRGSSFLETAYLAWQATDGVRLGYFNRRYPDYTSVGDLIILAGQGASTTKRYAIIGWARTGPNVSSQEAGEYSATITLTVSATP